MGTNKWFSDQYNSVQAKKKNHIQLSSFRQLIFQEKNHHTTFLRSSSRLVIWYKDHEIFFTIYYLYSIHPKFYVEDNTENYLLTPHRYRKDLQDPRAQKLLISASLKPHYAYLDVAHILNIKICNTVQYGPVWFEWVVFTGSTGYTDECKLMIHRMYICTA